MTLFRIQCHSTPQKAKYQPYNMTKSAKLILFIFSVIVFLVLAPVLVLYNMGYRYDWATESLQKTGGLFLSSTPARATILLDGAKQGPTTNGYLSSLTPKIYTAKIELSGYLPWEKTLKIYPQIVTTANAVLVPQHIAQTALFATPAAIANFFVSPNRNDVVYTATAGSTESINLFDLTAKTATPLYAGNIGVKNITFDATQTKLLVSFQTPTTANNWMVINTLDGSVANITTDLGLLGVAPTSVQQINFDPADNNTVLVALPTSVANTGTAGNATATAVDVMAINYQKISTDTANGTDIAPASATAYMTPLLTNITRYVTAPHSIYFITAHQQLKQLNLLNHTTTAIADVSNLQLSGPVNIKTNGNNVLLENQGKLYWIAGNPSDGNLAKTVIATGVNYFSFSPDGEKVAAVTNTKTIVYYLTTTTNQPFKQAYDITLVTNDSPKDVFWYPDSENLFLVYPDKIMFSDIDDRSKLNQYTIATIPALDHAWWYNNVYVSTNDNVYLLNFLGK